jgi:hypothetical protein
MIHRAFCSATLRSTPEAWGQVDQVHGAIVGLEFQREFLKLYIDIFVPGVRNGKHKHRER